MKIWPVLRSLRIVFSKTGSAISCWLGSWLELSVLLQTYPLNSVVQPCFRWDKQAITPESQGRCCLPVQARPSHWLPELPVGFTHWVLKGGVLSVQAAKGHRYRTPHSQILLGLLLSSRCSKNTPTSMQGSNVALGFSISSCQGLGGLYVKGKEWFCQSKVVSCTSSSIKKCHEILGTVRMRKHHGRNPFPPLSIHFLLLNVLC